MHGKAAANGSDDRLGAPLAVPAIHGQMSFVDLIDNCMVSFNAGRLSEACRLYTELLKSDSTQIALSVSGALVPAGLGRSCLIPMMRLGFVDWIVSTGANLYHDLQTALGFAMHAGSPHADDVRLREDGIVRIYDLYFRAEGLFATDEFIRDTLRSLVKERILHGRVSSSAIHRALGEEILRIDPAARDHSVLACAVEMGVPIHTSSPGDSGIGMNIAALALEGVDLTVDPNLDVNETAAYVYHAKRTGGESAVLIVGGGSPKNFLLQTEPHIQEVLGLEESGHDHFIQFTDARPDTGGLSGATPSEAVSWGKIDPTKLQGTVVCYGDSTVYWPLLVRYATERVAQRRVARLMDHQREMVESLKSNYDRVRLNGVKR